MTRPLRLRAAFTLAAAETIGLNVVRPTRADLARWREQVRPVLALGENDATEVLTHGMAVVIDRLCVRVEELESAIQSALLVRDWRKDTTPADVEIREILQGTGSYEEKS